MSSVPRRAWLRQAAVAVVGALALGGCATLLGEPPRVQLAGLELLPSKGLEWRFALELRVQNPNGSELSFDGISLELDLDRQRIASGVAPVQARIPGYGEQLLTVPVTVSALELARRLLAHRRSDGRREADTFEYVLRGRLGGVLPGGVSFESRGTIGADALRR
ncbi:MAG: LEA type 2 family protein [Rubrivivax sp.]